MRVDITAIAIGGAVTTGLKSDCFAKQQSMSPTESRLIVSSTISFNYDVLSYQRIEPSQRVLTSGLKNSLMFRFVENKRERRLAYSFEARKQIETRMGLMVGR
ncbi:hypothetical protein M0804_008978 [Polistes exclamans]|nr:hypothetical protein M0804_008978 [Polistes exclamans]